MLDGLRLAAALLVVAFHYLAYPGGAWNRPTSELFPHLHLVAGYGRFGVELFFMISGFVICMSSWGRSLGDYFTSRVVRLFPAYWFAVLATTAVVAVVPGGITPHAWREVLVNLTMLHRPVGVDDVDGVYWTLWAEVRFYIVFAVIAWRGLTYRIVVTFCALWSVAAILTHHYTFGPLQALVLPGECWFFIAGLAFYLIRRFGPDLLLWSIVALAYAMGQWQMLDVRRDVVHSLGYSIPAAGVTALITLFFVTMAAVALGRLDRIRWRWLTTAGALTYPLYLLHEYIGWEVIRTLRGHAPPLALAAGTAVAMRAGPLSLGGWSCPYAVRLLRLPVPACAGWSGGSMRQPRRCRDVMNVGEECRCLCPVVAYCAWSVVRRWAPSQSAAWSPVKPREPRQPGLGRSTPCCARLCQGPGGWLRGRRPRCSRTPPDARHWGSAMPWSAW